MTAGSWLWHLRASPSGRASAEPPPPACFLVDRCVPARLPSPATHLPALRTRVGARAPRAPPGVCTTAWCRGRAASWVGLGRVRVLRGEALAAVAIMGTTVRGRLLLMAATEEVPVEGVIVAAFAQPYRKPIEHAGKPYQVSDHFCCGLVARGHSTPVCPPDVVRLGGFRWTAVLT